MCMIKVDHVFKKCEYKHLKSSKNFRVKWSVTPTMRLYLPRVEARLRGITALWFCRKKGHLHTIPCNEQEWDKELAYNHHFTQYINKFIHHSRYTHRPTMVKSK